MPTKRAPDVVVDVDAGGLRLPLSAARIRAVAALVLRRERVRHALISIAFLTRRRIAALHRSHLGRRGSTDVITFALGRPGRGAIVPLVGDIYVAPEVVARRAREWGVPLRQELARAVVHGVLHALGHDHPETEARLHSPMWRRQEGHVRAARRQGLW
jgi:probable rRNA maturation factor